MRLIHSKTLLLSALLLGALWAGSLSAQPLGTSFTYQGQLADGNAPATGLYDMIFSLHNAARDGTPVASPLSATVPVTNGLFTVLLDFGGAPFNGSMRWLELGVRPNGSGVAHTPQLPRTALTATPNALYAHKAGSVESGANQPLEFKVNGARVLRAEPTATTPNLIGGFAGNYVSNGVVGAFIGGGGADNLSSLPSTNRVFDNFGTLCGGASNTVGTANGLPGDAQYCFLGGGFGNISDGYCAVIGGGAYNWASGGGAPTVAGGWHNTASGWAASIGGGADNVATNTDTTISGGYRNRADGLRSTVGGGFSNQSKQEADTVGGGYYNIATGSSSVVGGGYQNLAGSPGAGAVTVAGGTHNTATGPAAFVGGGGYNQATGGYSSIGGGEYNEATGAWTSVSGGRYNSAVVDAASIGGGIGNYAHGHGSTISGGANNQADLYATVGGGLGNTSEGPYANVAGGVNNRAATNYATIGGGSGNAAVGPYDFIGGGEGNTTVYDPQFSNGLYRNVIGGGEINKISNARHGTIGGGKQNEVAWGYYGTVGGGKANVASATAATVPGGYENNADGYSAFAAGYRAKAMHGGSFVWADQNAMEFRSLAINQFSVRCTGGARFVTGIDGNGNPTSGVRLEPGWTSWGTISDRNVKKNFQPVDGKAILTKLARVPITKWNYQWDETNATPHLGPMAQDFKAAFYPGRDDKVITTFEFDGVELAAIQGLNELMSEKAARIAALEERVATLEKQLAAEHQTLARWETRFNALEQAASRVAAPNSEPLVSSSPEATK